MEIKFDGRYGEQTDSGYVHYSFQNPEKKKLKELICNSSPIGHPWGEATISRSIQDEKQSLILLSTDTGYFIQSNDKDKISCWDETCLHEIVCPDDFDVPLGCVVPVEKAWEVVTIFIDTGDLSDSIKWISWDDILKDAAWTYDK